MVPQNTDRSGLRGSLLRRLILGLRVAVVPQLALVVCCAAIASPQIAQCDVIVPDFAPVVSGSLNNIPLMVNRNSQAVCSYGSGGSRTNSFLLAGPGIDTPKTLVLPIGHTTFFYDFSNWGVAVESDRNGYIPTDIYAADLSASSFTDLQTANGDQSAAVISDSGDIAWSARSTSNTPRNTLFTWNLSLGLHQVPNPASQLSYALAGMDGHGNVLAPYRNEDAVPYTFWIGAFDGSTWTSIPADRMADGGPHMLINPSGQMAYLGQYSDPTGTRWSVDFFDGTQNMRLVDATRNGTPNSQRLAKISLADNGEVLSIVAPAIGGSWQCTLAIRRACFWTSNRSCRTD